MNQPTHPPADSVVGKRTALRTLWWWAKRIVVGILALIIAVALVGLAYQTLSEARDMRRFPPPGKLVDVGGFRLHIHSIGDGRPAVIFDSGLGDSSLTWFKIQPEVAKFARASSYDRAGYDWSDTSRSPRTSKEIVRELHTLLTNDGIPGPYVLVGHSFGGSNVRLFAHEYPQETAGIVLVDSSHEDQASRFPPSLQQARNEYLKRYQLLSFLSHLGVVRQFVIEPNEKFPATLRPVDIALNAQTRFLTTLCREMSSLAESATQVRAGSTLPEVPLAVVSAGHEGEAPEPGISPEDSQKMRTVWRELQADLATRTKNSIHFAAAKSSHYIQHDQPDLVVDAIRKVVASARNKEPLNKSED